MSMQSKPVLHWHHIVPRHAGGTDDPSNLVQLTVEDHAKAHLLRYEELGEEYDLIAYELLSKNLEMGPDVIERLRAEGQKRFLSDPARVERWKNSLSNRDHYASPTKSHLLKMSEGRKTSKRWRDSMASQECREKKRMSSPRRQRVCIDGLEYESIRQAARASGININRLYSIRDGLRTDDRVSFL